MTSWPLCFPLEGLSMPLPDTRVHLTCWETPVITVGNLPPTLLFLWLCLHLERRTSIISSRRHMLTHVSERLFERQRSPWCLHLESASESPLCWTDTVITRVWGLVLPWEGGVWAFIRCLARIRGHPVVPDWVLSHCEQCSWGSIPCPRK